MSELSVGQLKGLTVNNNTITVPAGHKIYEPGSVVQVKTASSGFVNQTIVSATPVLLSGMSVTITPKFSTSKLVVQAMVVASYTYVSSVHIYRDGVDIVPNHGGNSQSGGATALWTHYQSSQESSRANQVFSMPIIYDMSANSTATTTIDIRANSGWSGGTESFRFNNRDSADMLGTSFLSIWEIAQ